MWWIILLVLAAIVVAIFIYLRIVGHGSFPWIQFYTKGKESGFSFREVGLLRKIAIETQIENPTALFWSIKQLNRSIKEMIIKLRSRDMIDDEESNHLLLKLYDLRKRVEFDLPRYRLGLKSSRDIAPRQRMRAMLPGAGPFATMVIENRTKYLALSRPQGPGLPEGFMWKGQQIGLHFWRAEDAGYFMRTKVINDFISQKYPIIHVAHTDDIERTQQRRSIRVKTNLPATVYPLKSIQDANELEESAKGLRCRLLDISEDGACLAVGGRTKAGMPIKIQFVLSDRMIVMCGLVKGVNYDNKKNVSLLHVQGIPPSIRTRNAISTFVYNIFGDQNPDNAQSKPTV
jgi:c-di-GMP-binding flagellar brake protein YcgR